MALEEHPNRTAVTRAQPPAWGELAPAGETALAVRFVLPDRVVTFPFAEFRRWEHVAGEPEILTISAGKELIVIEGDDLAVISAAFDLARVCEVRFTAPRTTSQPGPRVRAITIELA